MSIDKILIKQAEKDEETQIAESWRKAYPILFKYKYPERWKWMFINNPFLRDKNKLPVWIAKDEQQVVAWSCAMVIPVSIDNTINYGAFGVDAFTMKKYRKRGLGKKLQIKNQDSHEVFFSISMSPATRRNKLRIGGQPGRPFYIYFKLLRELNSERLYNSLLESIEGLDAIFLARMMKKIKKCGFEIILCKIISILLIMKHKFPKEASKYHRFLKKDLIFEPIETFGPETDAFWNMCRSKYGFAVPRTREYLNWKYIDQPHVTYKKYFVRENDNSICGILIYRLGILPEIPVGVISEIITNSEDIGIYQSMVDFAEIDLIKSGAHMIKCGSSLSKLSKVLESASYIRVRVNDPVIHIKSKLSGNINYKNIFKKDWLMTLGDQDMDQFLVYEQPTLSHILRAII